MPYVKRFVVLFLLFFFFQAEDGIRALIVTGVQTCALPIYRHVGRVVVPAASAVPRHRAPLSHVSAVARRRSSATIAISCSSLISVSSVSPPQIGRASCRERV